MIPAWLRARLGLRPPGLDALGFVLDGPAVMREGRFEPEETALVLALLDKAEVLVNVGANVGYYACHARRKGRQVVAVEPMPGNLRLLRANLAANGWTEGVEIHPVALADRAGTMRIYGGGTGASLVRGWAGQTRGRDVAVTTLDALLGDRFAGRRLLILVDIEGAEQAMLRGAARTLAMTPRPVWFVEIAARVHQPKGVPVNPTFAATFETFAAAGYAGWTATAAPRRVAMAEVAAI